MKLTIIKKKIKEGISDRTGSPYKISSLFVKFDDEAMYDKIVAHLKGKGATDEQIEKFCKPNEYKGKINYAFGLNCSNFTFNKVEQFGELDANINFTINDSGFINAKIHVVDKKEQVNGYTPPESEVEGWAITAPEPHGAKAVQSETNGGYSQDGAERFFSNILKKEEESLDDDLPF